MNIERRRRWIEHIEFILFIELADFKGKRQTPVDLLMREHRKRLLSLLRRVRRCPECHGRGLLKHKPRVSVPVMLGMAYRCPTCGGTGRL